MSKRNFPFKDKFINQSTGELLPDNEIYWQQLTVFNYLVFEAISAMEQEKVSGGKTPLNLHWQQFIDHLLMKKPNLRTCLNNLISIEKKMEIDEDDIPY